MLTLFTIAKPFVGPIDLIQRNALASWRRAFTNSRIFVFGLEQGTRDTCLEFDLQAAGELSRSATGRYLVGHAFERARQMASTGDDLCYLNCDIMISKDFPIGWQSVKTNGISPFLLSARRRKAQVQADLSNLQGRDFESAFDSFKRVSPLDGYSAIDMFCFSKRWEFDLPNFSVGEVAWDNWMIRSACEAHIPVIDGTQDITLLHQEHAPTISGPINPERTRNLALAGDLGRLRTLRDSSLLLRSGRLQHPGFLRRIVRTALDTPAGRTILRLKRQAKSVEHMMLRQSYPEASSQNL